MSSPVSPSKICATARLLAAFPAFSGLDREMLARLGAQSLRLQRARGDALFEQGAPAEALYLITSGIVKLSRGLPPDETQLMGLFGPRDCIGGFSLDATALHSASAHAASEFVEAWQVSATALREGVAEDPRLLTALLRAATSFSEVLTAKIDVLGGGSVPKRLARLFVMLSERFGDELEGGEWVIPVPLSRRELSLLVGSCMESVIRVVSVWQKQGLLRTGSSGFELLAPRAFHELASGAESDPLVRAPATAWSA
ncbi:MAG: Crp/Fnr family transcriptional regulator [Polyangiaceae bacterium]